MIYSARNYAPVSPGDSTTRAPQISEQPIKQTHTIRRTLYGFGSDSGVDDVGACFHRARPITNSVNPGDRQGQAALAAAQSRNCVLTSPYVNSMKCHREAQRHLPPHSLHTLSLRHESCNSTHAYSNTLSRSSHKLLKVQMAC